MDTAAALPRTPQADHPHDTGALARRPEEVAAGTPPDSSLGRGLRGVRHVLDLACDPSRAPRASLGYYLSPGTGSWDALVQCESALSGELHATVARRRYLQWNRKPGRPEAAAVRDHEILECWSRHVEGLRHGVFIPTRDGGADQALVLERVGAWVVVAVAPDGLSSLTWGPMGLAAAKGTVEEMRAHLAALATLPDHSEPGWRGDPGTSAEYFLRGRLAAERSVTP